MHWVHFYPFPPFGDHGGTLRLQTAELACRDLGDQRTFWYDVGIGSWREDLIEPDAPGKIAQPGIKRRIFPSTLYESGRSAVAAFRETDWAARFDQPSNAIFHTTYLGPLLKDERPTWLHKRVIDAYDLVWRAHAIDAGLGGGAVRTVRRFYSTSVKQREMGAIAHADAIAVAGYEDWRHVEGLETTSAWCPTGLVAQPHLDRVSNATPRVGFLGNFAHQPTVDSARYLLGCPAAGTGEVKIILGGWDSQHFAEEFAGHAEVIGPVDSPAEFWRRVDCAVIPVQTGAGMKCKISEALLSSCPVITTPLGAEGFPPAVRELMHVVNSLSEVTGELCRAIDRPDPTSAALIDLTRAGATARYAKLLLAAS